MTFGRGIGMRDAGNGHGAPQRSRAAFLWACLTLGFCLLMSLAGCGGGGGDDNNNQVVTRVTGTVREYYTNAAVVNATVRYGGQTTTTDGNGNFAFEQNAAYPAQNLAVTAATPTDYQTKGQYGTTRVQDISGTGFAVAAVTAGQTLPIGNVYLFSADYPPPPPSLP